MSECGCKIVGAVVTQGAAILEEGVRIEYCPLHASAQKLRDALEAAEPLVRFAHRQGGMEGVNSADILLQINSALLAAPKGTP